MTRLTSMVLASGLLALLATPAFAQQAELAAKLNDEGKDLMYDGKYAEASAKFQQAVARVPEPKYFFNLCTSLYQEGKFSDAMTACGGVGKNNPTADLEGKTKKMMERIESEAKAQNVPLVLTGGGGGDPNQDPQNPNPQPDPQNPNPGPGPGPQPTYQQAYGRPPAQSLYKATTSDNKYTWTLGADLFGGGGTIGDRDVVEYGNVAAGIRLKGDYLLRAPQRIGAQAYLQYSRFQEGEDQQGGAYDLDVMDLGIALYKHVCLTGTQRLCITPLVGAHLAFMSPSTDSNSMDFDAQLFNYTALGGRVEVGAHYAFGTRYEHVLGIGVGANLYTGVFSESMEAGASARDIGLDKGGAVGYISVGYTYRFNTPLGSSPFVTLE